MSEMIGRECKFVIHIPKDENINRPDLHFIKEVIHYSDGTKKRNIRVIENFKRPFYITKPHYQTHKDKKESELLKRLNIYKSTQSDLAKNIATRLGSKYVGVKSLRDVVSSPYVYGIDVSSTAIIKKMYMDKYPNVNSPSTIATLDIETDLETDEITIITIATNKNVYTAILDKILKNYTINKSDAIKKLTYLFNKYVPDTELKKNVKVEYEIFNKEIDMIKAIFKKLHTWEPDFLAIWNITFDMGKILEVINKNNIDPVDIFSTDKIPKNYRYFKFKEGQKSKLTESGKFKPVSPEEQWHTYYSTSSFYFIDMMSAHRYIRVGGKTPPGGYSLDNILKIELGDKLQKLKFNDTTQFKGIDWHYHMQKNKPLEYIIYNQWDSMSMIELDNKTKDLSISLPMLAGISGFDIFNSGPKKIVDAMHFYYLEHGKVLASKPPRVDDDKILGLDEWIAILPSYRIKNNGLRIIEESSNIITNIRSFTYDSDAVSSYPSNTLAANVSKDTTKKEIINIEGIQKDVFKLQNINLMFGPVNSIEYCTTMLNFPTIDQIDKYIKNIE